MERQDAFPHLEGREGGKFVWCDMIAMLGRRTDKVDGRRILREAQLGPDKSSRICMSEEGRLNSGPPDVSVS